MSLLTKSKYMQGQQCPRLLWLSVNNKLPEKSIGEKQKLEQGHEFEEYAQAQMVWLDSILTNNPQKWTAITLHYPFFSTKPSRDNPELRARFRPIIEKHNVDIVLQGHDHAYGRGMAGIPSALDSTVSTNTMYVVSVSGPKMYDLAERSWMTRRAANTQFFHVVTVKGDTLNFKAYTATRELYDEFDLIKKSDGTKKLVDKKPDLPEKL